MREIKFRVWDNGAKMYQQMSAMMNVHTGHISDLPGRHILEQFTGLHDKNGKEIYEGDILKESMLADPMKVIYHNGSFVAYDGLGPSLPILGGSLAYEVIGNIHENPEIVK